MSDMKQQLKIGEFSKLCRVTVKTLRNYEELGLLRPASVDEWTGYRLYDLSQFQQMGAILHLKRMGFSLEEIRDVFRRGADKPDLDVVRQRLLACRTELGRLQRSVQELESLEQQLMSKNNMETMTLKTIPARMVASYRGILKSYDELGDICVRVIGPEMMRVGCTCPEPQYCYTIEHEREHRETDIDVEYCEAVGELHDDTEILRFYEAPAIDQALCYQHRGPYTSFGESMARVMLYLDEHGWKPAGEPRFAYIDGAWNCADPADWLTEIQVPVEKVEPETLRRP